MRVVLAVVWLLTLCLTVTAQETMQRFDTNADGNVGFRVENVEPIREEEWPTSRSTISR